MATTKPDTSADGVIPAAEPAALEPLTPTVTHYQQLAATFSASLDDIVTVIPQLPEGYIATVNFVRSHLNVPLGFIVTMISAVEQTPALQGVGMFDPTEARDTLQLLEAFRPVLYKLTAFQKTLELTLNSRVASLGNDALAMYQIAKGVARDPKNAGVKSLVAKLKRELGRPGRPSPKPKEVASA